jgi:glyoxylase-like metal-dependent hydrolase (beta-lactamase superfamily II)
VIGYLESLDKLEKLSAEILAPSHGLSTKDPAQAIQKFRQRLLKRENTIIEILQRDGPKTFWEIAEGLFQGRPMAFYPGCGLVESHLIKLERDGIIQREGLLSRLND